MAHTVSSGKNRLGPPRPKSSKCDGRPWMTMSIRRVAGCPLLLLFLLLSLATPRWNSSIMVVSAAAAVDDDNTPAPSASPKPTPTPLECELYIGTSTIPNAGMGIFSGVAKRKGDTIGNGDKAIPLVDMYWNNGDYYDENEEGDGDHPGDGSQKKGFFNPLSDYVWDGYGMGMGKETENSDDVTTFWPGMDAMVNGHLGLLNVEKAYPKYDEEGLHRSKHPGAGAISLYGAGRTEVIRDIPAGGELFKYYGDHWFTTRQHVFGNIPLWGDYHDIIKLMRTLQRLVPPNNDALGLALYNDVLLSIKDIWDSRTLNALHDFSWEDMKNAVQAKDIGILFQPAATRSIEWLNEHGWCIDHIVSGPSTIEGAGHGAFAKRDLPKGTTITATPLIHYPNYNFATMYEGEEIVTNNTDGKLEYKLDHNGRPKYRRLFDKVIGKQLLVNYCFGHPTSTILLCPYGAGVNYINHNQTKANVKLQWAAEGSTNHDSTWLNETPENMNWVYRTKLVLEYVTTRDVSRGEELFLDYGPSWQQAWDEHVKVWSQVKDSRVGYISALQFNMLYGNIPIRTNKEQRTDPYPENLSTVCHSFLADPRWDENVPNVKLDALKWTEDDAGLECSVLERDDQNVSYVVVVATEDDDGNREVWTTKNVPRQAIRFVDTPYSTDMHLPGAFRHPLGIPDDIMPQAWRNLMMVSDDGYSESEGNNNNSCAAETNVEPDWVARLFPSLGRLFYGETPQQSSTVPGN